ncbi:SPFH domain-containing protein [Marichromatium gracile]|uniref:Band 7 protein n=2 Tax=Marichromatium TaxID=85076 RepID=A0A4R4ACV6_MARGR|nr:MULTISPECIES: SPFH domain-containing protein [Marichromatium]MBO8086143.1 SPFH domain-containing protein [Marichromatium sp.]KXX66392.1 band 7 protein [Marichromatium gracile]MBK1710469.1 band 7 protein [Marichromatium gracile]MCF1184457.1 SPFH domain-containing protein [Marichromatium gracile]NKN34184.1 SPFH/Band 7/PHB domain protein [Marichromatium bheemlicum]
MDNMIGSTIAFVIGLIYIPVLLAIARSLGLYAVVREREAQVFTLFGKVIGTLDEPGLRFPLAHFGLRALLLPFFGKRYKVSTALRQHYLRDQMVNSEEGTPMGVGLWYEMQVSDPIAYLFNNANPEGSLQANVASAAVSTLSNLEMDKMLEDRHQLSRRVRAEVSPLSERWGYRLGSVYIRKVAFTDRQMVDNITDKVVKRLIQVTSAMKQDGENRVGLIQSQTAYKVSQQMAEAAATRPAIVGEALNAIAERDPEVLDTVLEVMETEQLLASKAEVEVLPRDSEILVQLGATL